MRIDNRKILWFGNSLNKILRHCVYSSAFAAHKLFDVRLTPLENLSFFEACTLVMQQALKQELHDGMRVADVGTGPYAILSLWALHHWQLDLVATDLEARYIEWAGLNAKANHVKLDATCCDILESSSSNFDVIWFVPPYLSRTQTEKWLRISGIEGESARLLRSRSCGGIHGWETIERFLDVAPHRLRKHGKIFLTLNQLHQPLPRVRKMMEGDHLRMIEEKSLFHLPYKTMIAIRR